MPLPATDASHWHRRPRALAPQWTAVVVRSLVTAVGLGVTLFLLRSDFDSGGTFVCVCGLVCVSGYAGGVLVRDAWLARYGLSVEGAVVDKRQEGGRTLLVHEYRELPGGERLRGTTWVSRATFDAVNVGDRIVVFHSLWAPQLSAAEPFACFRPLLAREPPPAGSAGDAGRETQQ